MRLVTAAAVAAASLVPLPSHATGPVVLICALTYAGYGVGSSSGTGTCTATGARTGSVQLTFVTNMPPAMCPALETSSGTMTGLPGLGPFVWNRVGSVGPISVSGDKVASGMGHWFVKSPVGNPCGARNVTVEATFAF